MKFMLPLAASLLMTPSAPAQTAAEVPTFLAGCWEQRSGETLIQEQWMVPLAGQTLGMARTVRQGRMVAWEQLRIETTATGLDYVAMPSGQALTRFALVRQTATMVEFNNPAHDFPTTVRYTLQAPGELLAQIEGLSKGQPRDIHFRYRRVACP